MYIFSGGMFPDLFQNHEEKEPFGPGCRDYFWLICHLIDGITKEDVELSWEQVCSTCSKL